MAGPAVVYVIVRLVGLLVLDVLSGIHDQSPSEHLFSWDSDWYLRIAESGYDPTGQPILNGNGDADPQSVLAFFPGFPMLTRGVAFLPGVDPPTAAMLVNLAAGLACAYGLARLGRIVSGSQRAGLVLVALFAAAPMSIVLSMPYSESLFCALAIWTLLGVLERRWIQVGVTCALAGTVRHTGAALIAVVMLAAVVALLHRHEGNRPLAALLAAPCGLLGYLGWVGLRTGELDGYFEVRQDGWSSSPDGGIATARFIGEALSTEESTFVTFAAWILLGAVALLICCLDRRIAWPLGLYALLTVVFVLGTDGLMFAKPRALLPAFPLLLPLAMGLAARRRAVMIAGVGIFVCFGSWFSAYALTVWPYAF
ncbi:hypothetical protein SAMN04487904_112123 [Actinopolyspora lacussalsi subsp. righensis]|uniref:Dolichyl-phosphate-mannose-protein mannosyltransferase n=1 Tax=Actinopolyspora righensis TaxID=995060 RepID=A0A1I7BRS3_9ACTN|nr:hypothetical protein SAMN04487904_112123 [Actinopolyspora righensis]